MIRPASQQPQPDKRAFLESLGNLPAEDKITVLEMIAPHIIASFDDKQNDPVSLALSWLVGMNTSLAKKVLDLEKQLKEKS